MKIIVPATSANLGPGFDSCGIALNKYLTVEVGEVSDEWVVKHALGEMIPSDNTNLLIQTALLVKADLQPRTLHMESEIPLTRGLGSSSSVIVAGIELANQLGELHLSPKEKLDIATNIEGHPDNVAPAIYGDFVLASNVEERAVAVRHEFPKTAIVAYIPETHLSTEESRKVLPSTMSFKEAVAASSIANVMIGAILQNDMKLAGEMIEKDLFHEKYRASLVPHVSVIRKIGRKHHTYASYLSGAGPTVITFLPHEDAKNFITELNQTFETGGIEQLEVAPLGVIVK